MNYRYSSIPKWRKSKAKARVNEDIVRTQPDNEKATGADDENDVVEEVEVELPAIQDGFTTLATSRLLKCKNRKKHSTSEASSPFMFVNLPAEIRNMIYRYLVVSESTHPIELHSETVFRPGGIETAILRVNRLIYLEALEILYTKNKCIALVSLEHSGISLRHDVLRTSTATARVLRSKREVDMVAHHGLIYPDIALRLRHLTFHVDLFDRTRFCDHLTGHFCRLMRNNLASSIEMLSRRAEERPPRQELLFYGLDWKVLIQNHSHTSFLTVKHSLRPLLSYPMEIILHQKRLTVELRGNFPKRWKEIFRVIRRMPNFTTNGVKLDRLAIKDEFPEAFGEDLLYDIDGGEMP